jgi:anti-anti-sigma regulatory factor
MGTTTTSDSDGTDMRDVETTLALPADLGIEHASSLKALLLPAATQPAPVRIDAAAASRLHAATLQLLAAFCRDRRDGGLQTQWVQVSTSLRDAAAVLGLNDLLQLSPEPA